MSQAAQPVSPPSTGNQPAPPPPPPAKRGAPRKPPEGTAKKKAGGEKTPKPTRIRRTKVLFSPAEEEAKRQDAEARRKGKAPRSPPPPSYIKAVSPSVDMPWPDLSDEEDAEKDKENSTPNTTASQQQTGTPSPPIITQKQVAQPRSTQRKPAPMKMRPSSSKPAPNKPATNLSTVNKPAPQPLPRKPSSTALTRTDAVPSSSKTAEVNHTNTNVSKTNNNPSSELNENEQNNQKLINVPPIPGGAIDELLQRLESEDNMTEAVKGLIFVMKEANEIAKKEREYLRELIVGMKDMCIRISENTEESIQQRAIDNECMDYWEV